MVCQQVGRMNANVDERSYVEDKGRPEPVGTKQGHIAEHLHHCEVLMKHEGLRVVTDSF